jgi:hypothetical protein
MPDASVRRTKKSMETALAYTQTVHSVDCLLRSFEFDGNAETVLLLFAPSLVGVAPFRFELLDCTLRCWLVDERRTRGRGFRARCELLWKEDCLPVSS